MLPLTVGVQNIVGATLDSRQPAVMMLAVGVGWGRRIAVEVSVGKSSIGRNSQGRRSEGGDGIRRLRNRALKAYR